METREVSAAARACPAPDGVDTDDDGVRKRYQRLTFMRVKWKRTSPKSRRRVVECRCECGQVVIANLGKWQESPPASCSTCALDRSKKKGFGSSPPWRRVGLGALITKG